MEEEIKSITIRFFIFKLFWFVIVLNKVFFLHILIISGLLFIFLVRNFLDRLFPSILTPYTVDNWGFFKSRFLRIVVVFRAWRHSWNTLVVRNLLPNCILRVKLFDNGSFTFSHHFLHEFRLSLHFGNVNRVKEIIFVGVVYYLWDFHWLWRNVLYMWVLAHIFWLADYTLWICHGHVVCLATRVKVAHHCLLKFLSNFALDELSRFLPFLVFDNISILNWRESLTFIICDFSPHILLKPGKLLLLRIITDGYPHPYTFSFYVKLLGQWMFLLKVIPTHYFMSVHFCILFVTIIEANK